MEVQILFHFLVELLLIVRQLRANHSPAGEKLQVTFLDVLSVTKLHLVAVWVVVGDISLELNHFAKRMLPLNIGWKPCLLVLKNGLIGGFGWTPSLSVPACLLACLPPHPACTAPACGFAGKLTPQSH